MVQFSDHNSPTYVLILATYQPHRAILGDDGSRKTANNSQRVWRPSYHQTRALDCIINAARTI